MTDHEHIERRLHEAASDISVGTSLPSEVRRRVNVRRTATMATSVVAVVALAFGAAFAAGTFDVDLGTGPARAPLDGSVLIDYRRTGGFEGSEIHLTIKVDGQSVIGGVNGTLGYNVEGRLTPDEMSRLEATIEGVEWEAVDGSHLLPAETVAADAYRYEIGHETYRVVTETGAEPAELRALISFLDAFLENRSSDEFPSRCGLPVDFRPTYLPEGWIEDLQVGSAGEAEWSGLLGHYGNEQLPGTTSKAEGGFAELMTGESPYALTGGERIRVLDEPARFGAIHEGFAVEFSQYDCDYVLLGFGIEGDELRRFAEGLRLPGTYVEPSPGPNSEIESDGFALWPEDTPSEAAAACAEAGRDPNSFRRGPMETAIHFSTQVLGWAGTAISRDSDGPGRLVELRRDRDDQGRQAQGPAVRVLVSEIEPLCWSVVGVSNPPDQPRRLEITVDGRFVEIGFDQVGADRVSYEVGHGMYTMTSSPVRTEGRIDIHLTYTPDEPGHYLLLFRDSEGVVFSAEGAPLPAGAYNSR